MPRHKQVTTCQKGNGSISKFCTCPHCTLCVCEVCGAYEGGLTTDCPGTKVSFDRQQEVYETKLDYSDDRGWHQGEPTKLRSPRFEQTKLPPEPPRVDPRTTVAPSIDWATVDRMENHQHELTLKAIAWVLADRVAEEQSAALACIEDLTDPLRGKQELDGREQALLGSLERAKIDFKRANQQAEKCDDEFRQAAKKLVTVLENVRSDSSEASIRSRPCPGYQSYSPQAGGGTLVGFCQHCTRPEAEHSREAF